MESRNWRAATAAAGLLFVLATAWGVSQYNAKQASERELTARYQERFFEAVGNVDNIEVLLAKGTQAVAPKKLSSELSVSLFSDLWRQAFTAQANLNQLPLLQGTLMRTSKFLTQVGDFGYYVVRKVGAGSSLSGEDKKKLNEFRMEAAVVNSALREAQAKASTGIMPWGELRRDTNRQLSGKSREVDDTDFTRLEKQAVEFPTIIYDGPFSDNVVQRKPKGLTGPNVSDGKAESIALDFVPLQQKDGYVAETIGKVDGDVPAYQIQIRKAGRKSEMARIDVSQKGGHVIWMLNSRAITQPKLTLEQAGRKAKDFLVSRGLKDIVPTYANQADGRAIIPFAPVQNGVIIYPDLVKVTVALDTGEIVGYEALGYLMNHHVRTLPKPAITPKEALDSVSPDLQITGEPQLALIPLETLKEVLTYEIKGKADNAFYANYVDVRTGKLVRILQIVDTPEGMQAI